LLQVADWDPVKEQKVERAYRLTVAPTFVKDWGDSHASYAE
jgi:hypothetical protein